MSKRLSGAPTYFFEPPITAILPSSPSYIDKQAQDLAAVKLTFVKFIEHGRDDHLDL